MAKNTTNIKVQGATIKIVMIENEEYLSLTDIAGANDDRPDLVIQNWMRNKNTIDFLAEWERLHNNNFNSFGFEGIRNRVGENNFSLSVKKWLQETDAVGMQAKAGRYGGTYAHKDIAFAFGYWISPRFQLYVVKEFQRLKYAEAKELGASFAIQRELAKANDQLLNSALDMYTVPPNLAGTKKGRLYHAHEQDIINVIVYGQTANEWKRQNPDKKGNQRDYATATQLVVHNNLLSMDSRLLKWMVEKEVRENILLHMARDQFEIFKQNKAVKRLQERIDKMQKLLGLDGQKSKKPI